MLTESFPLCDDINDDVQLRVPDPSMPTAHRVPPSKGRGRSYWTRGWSEDSSSWSSSSMSR